MKHSFGQSGLGSGARGDTVNPGNGENRAFDTVMAERLRSVCGPRSYREIASMTVGHPETVRRYLRGSPASVDFVVRVAEAFGISLNWLLNGVGPMYRSEVRDRALRDGPIRELLEALSAKLEEKRRLAGASAPGGRNRTTSRLTSPRGRPEENGTARPRSIRSV